MTLMSNVETYRGGCHCGSVRFEVQTDLAGVIACNCSICSRVGSILTFVPVNQFKQLAGENAQTDYQFNTKNIHHLFCSTCGVRSFGHGIGPDGKPMYAINVRALEGVDLDALQITKFDGKNL